MDFRSTASAALGELAPLEVLASTPRRLQNLLALHDDSVLQARAADGWSVQETIAHLADSESVFAVRLRSVLIEQDPVLAGYDHDAWQRRVGLAGLPASDHIARFTLLRKANLAICGALSETELHRSGRHVSQGSETVADLIELRAGHDLLHLGQIAAVTGELDRPAADPLRGEALDKADPLVARPRSGRLIAFTGIDGAGKTSHALRLVDWLTTQGKDAQYRKNAGIRAELDHLARAEGHLDGNEMFGVETARLLGAVVRWKAMLSMRPELSVPGRYLVVDRYTYCEYAATTQQGSSHAGLLRSMYRGLPEPDLTFFLDVRPETALARIQSRQIDAEQLDFLRAFDRAYRVQPEFDSFVVVPAEGSFAEVQALIRQHVVARFGPELPGVLDGR